LLFLEHRLSEASQPLASRNLDFDGILGLIDRHASLTHW